jgi:two-component system sensor histidine kinase KdpD
VITRVWPHQPPGVVTRFWRPLSGRRLLAGAAVSVLGIALAVAVLIPERRSLGTDSAALVLVVPVALGVAIGGFVVAPVGVVLGFLAFDFYFIPPYGTLRIGAAEHWVTAGVYTAVSLVVGGVVAQAQAARELAERREAEVRILYELAAAVAAADSLGDALQAVVRLAGELFGLASAAVVLDAPGGLQVVASEGEALAAGDLERLVPLLPLGDLRSVPGAGGLLAGGLPTVSGPPGALVVRAAPEDAEALRLLVLFASQAGVAVERARLAEETARAMTLAEVDRLRSALMASVSHDLRTPLASIKTSVADLADPEVTFTPEARQMLLATIEAETDRLTHFVANLLDMTRIESGALRLNRSATPIDELVAGVVARFAPVLTGPVTVTLPDDLPLVDADYVLVDQVVANLLENVARHCPPGTSVTLSASSDDAWVEVRVSDDGPGIAVPDGAKAVESLHGRSRHLPRGTGMGLAICAGIADAHGGSLRAEPNVSGGTTFVLRLPRARPSPAPAELVPQPPAPVTPGC